MSIGILIYLASLAVIYVAERLLDGYEPANLIVAVAGLAGFVAAVVLRLQRMRQTDDPGLRWGHRRMLDFFGVAAAGLLFYFVGRFGLLGESERAIGAIGAIWPALLLVATTALVIVDHALQASPIVMPRHQVAGAMWTALSAGFAVALVFPVNYLADRHNERWDFSYFKTAEPGTATKNIIAELPKPIDVRIFQPTSSEVLPELQDYFSRIDSPNITVEVLDQAAHPQLSRKLRVRDNGYIALTEGEVLTAGSSEEEKQNATQQPITKTIKLGTTLGEARVKLKNLDQEVQKALLSFARGEVKAYHTVGHGELVLGGGDSNPMRTGKGLKQILDYMNLRPQKLGLTEGLGEGVPEDADVVLVLGPDRGLLPEEVESLRKYLDRGGALLLAVEPPEVRQGKPEFETEDTLKPLLDDLGIHLGEGVLASETMVVPTANNVSDRLNVATDRFSSHPSTAVLSNRRGQLKLFTPGAGYFVDKKKTAKGKVTITVRSHSASWPDKNLNLQLDKDQAESKGSRPLAVAVEGKGEDGFRAIVVADASLFADFPIVNPGNQQFVYDSLNWLTGQEALSGEVENEEDVRIQHTKEGQAGWFYVTVIGIPMLFFAFGLVRLRLRRRGGEA